jgi:hypothetical protein
MAFAERYDLHKDINESRRELEHEKAYTQRTVRREREQHSTLNVLGLSEVEAVEYALMLSREEEERRRLSRSIDHGVLEGDFEDEVLLPVASSSLPTHGFPSPHSSSSSLCDHHSRAYPRAARPATNEKVQVSPVFVPEPTEAGVTISPLRMSASLPGSSTATKSLPVVTHGTSSPNEHFPLISSSLSSSSGKSISGSPDYPRSAWNTPLRSTPSSYIDTPTLGMSDGSLPPASVDIRDTSEGEHPGAHDLDDLDDDMKFAIELSLAEARSRGEV